MQNFCRIKYVAKSYRRIRFLTCIVSGFLLRTRAQFVKFGCHSAGRTGVRDWIDVRDILLGGGGCAPLGELGPRVTQCNRGEAYLRAKFHLDPSSRLATIHLMLSVLQRL